VPWPAAAAVRGLGWASPLLARGVLARHLRRMAKSSRVRFEADVARELAARAAEANRSPSEIANATLRAQFAHERALATSITRGLAQLDAGEGVTTRAVKTRLARARGLRR
jgi:predicted transcriptional regulator